MNFPKITKKELETIGDIIVNLPDSEMTQRTLRWIDEDMQELESVEEKDCQERIDFLSKCSTHELMGEVARRVIDEDVTGSSCVGDIEVLKVPDLPSVLKVLGDRFTKDNKDIAVMRVEKQ
jgi:hypothetical protein